MPAVGFQMPGDEGFAEEKLRLTKNEEELLLKEIRVGIIGTGMISHTHMQRYAKIPNAKVVAACDLNQEKLDAWRA